MSASTSELAIHGGEPVVTIKEPEQWRPDIEKQLTLIRGILEEGAISGTGSGVPQEFEDKFREYIGAEYCVASDHGSAALASAFYAAKLGPGDEFLHPVVGYLGCFAGALHLGARPVFCEVDPETLLMDPADAERRITPKTRVINPIHMGGNVCDMDAFIALGKKYGVVIVEDAAHAHGAEWGGKKIGNLGDVAGFSLQGTTPGGKPVAAGEGGVLTTNSREIYERQLIYCHLHRAGITDELTIPEYRMLEAQVLGYKWRAHPLALAIGLVSLETLDYRIHKSGEYRETLFAALRELPGLQPEKTYPKTKRVSLYGGLKIIYDPEQYDGLPAGKFVQALQAEGAPVSGPGVGHMMHLKSLFSRGFDLWGHGRGPLGKDFTPYKKGDFPIAEDLATRILHTPCHIEPREGFLDQLIAAFEKVSENYQELLERD